MNFEQARFNMVEQQIRTWGVMDQNVLDLLFMVKREEFVPPAYRIFAFADTEIPLGYGNNMLSPKVEARILQALQIRKTAKVLEIGTGSGYLAALLAAHAEHVVSVEIVPELAELASINLRHYGIGNVTVATGDGSHGWQQSQGEVRYDAIVVTGAIYLLPRELLAQLKPGGRLFVFVGKESVTEAQLITRTGENGYHAVSLFETLAKPLINALQPNCFSF